MLLTAASHRPPALGHAGALKCHVTPSSLMFLMNELSIVSMIALYSRFKMLLAPTKLVPLSEYTCRGVPRRAHIRRKAARNAGVLRSATNSRWTAFVTRHTKTATYPFDVLTPRPLLALTSTWPVKSTPVLVKGREGLTLGRGRSAMIW